MSLFLVDLREHTGFKKGRNLSKIGQHTADTAELFFEDVRLPKSAILGKKKISIQILMFILKEGLSVLIKDSIVWWMNFQGKELEAC